MTAERFNSSVVHDTAETSCSIDLCPRNLITTSCGRAHAVTVNILTVHVETQLLPSQFIEDTGPCLPEKLISQHVH